MKTSIILATYNGAKFIDELLRSLMAQTDQDWELIVSDDGSTDDTLEIVGGYEPDLGARLTVIKNLSGSHGPNSNFINGLKNASGEYFMFCDQDDVWLPEKVERSLQAIERDEVSSSLPVLVSCALTVTDKDLNPIRNSRDHVGSYSKADVLSGFLTSELLLNGSSILFNRSARDFLLAEEAMIAQSGIVYDYWLCLYAALLGEVRLVETPLMLYRIHGSNTVGTKLDSSLSIKDAPKAVKDKAVFYADSRAALSYISGKYPVRDPQVRRLLALYLTGGVKHLLSKGVLVREGLLFPQGMTLKRAVLLSLM